MLHALLDAEYGKSTLAFAYAKHLARAIDPAEARR
jgi:hypothetical protein